MRGSGKDYQPFKKRCNLVSGASAEKPGSGVGFGGGLGIVRLSLEGLGEQTVLVSAASTGSIHTSASSTISTAVAVASAAGRLQCLSVTSVLGACNSGCLTGR